MSQSKNTYIVNLRAGNRKNGKILAQYTLKDFCKIIGLSYNTAIARAFKIHVKGYDEPAGGIIYIDPGSPIINTEFEPRPIIKKKKASKK